MQLLQGDTESGPHAKDSYEYRFKFWRIPKQAGSQCKTQRNISE